MMISEAVAAAQWLFIGLILVPVMLVVWRSWWARRQARAQHSRLRSGTKTAKTPYSR
jgi:hypothetical protein